MFEWFRKQFFRDQMDVRVGDTVWFCPSFGNLKGLGMDGRITDMQNGLATITYIDMYGNRQTIRKIKQDDIYGRVGWRARRALKMRH